MTLIELDEHAAAEVRPGDVVLIRATVIDSIEGVGARVELYSKTDQYAAWVRHDLVAALDRPDVPDEPADGTWLVAPDDGAINGGVNVFHRDDAGAPSEPERRSPRRWQVAGVGEWVDWPTVVARGGRPNRRLHDDGPTLPDELDSLADAVVEFLARAHSDARTIGYIGRTMRQTDHPCTDDEVQQVIDWLIARGRVELMPARTDRARQRPRYQLRNINT